MPAGRDPGACAPGLCAPAPCGGAAGAACGCADVWGVAGICGCALVWGWVWADGTACAVAAAETLPLPETVTVALATAHPAKFNEAVVLAGLEQQFPPEIAALFDLPQRQQLSPATSEAIAKRLTEFFGAATDAAQLREELLLGERDRVSG